MKAGVPDGASLLDHHCPLASTSSLSLVVRGRLDNEVGGIGALRVVAVQESFVGDILGRTATIET